jgi:hypothetical protein
MWGVMLIISLLFTYQFAYICAYGIYETLCHIKWSIIFVDVIISSIVYNMIYFLVYSIIKGSKSRNGK